MASVHRSGALLVGNQHKGPVYSRCKVEAAGAWREERGVADGKRDGQPCPVRPEQIVEPLVSHFAGPLSALAVLTEPAAWAVASSMMSVALDRFEVID